MSIARLMGSGTVMLVMVVCLSLVGCSTEPATTTGTGRVLVSVPLFEEHGIEWVAEGEPVGEEYRSADGEAWPFSSGACLIPMHVDDVRDEVQKTLTSEGGWYYEDMGGLYRLNKKTDDRRIVIILRDHEIGDKTGTRVTVEEHS